MRFKRGVRIFGIRPELLAGMMVVDACYIAKNLELTITSVTDGRHGKNSLHYSGCAFDCRIWDIEQPYLNELVKDIKDSLTNEFDVVLEKTHIHVEFQPEGPMPKLMEI